MCLYIFHIYDIFHEQCPQERHHIYGIVDDQSNASMITPDLTNKLKVNGPTEKHLLSMCSGSKTVKFRSPHPKTTNLRQRQDLETPNNGSVTIYPRIKMILTPEIARRFDHLKTIAHEIPPLDTQAKVQILIRRDAPQLLKVRAFKNGPRGAPRAQKLDN